MIITILNVLLGLSMIAVVGILLAGVVGLAVGGEFDRKYGNKLMRARVATQAIAVVVLLLRILAHDLVGG
jgi:hypothetical protein